MFFKLQKGEVREAFAGMRDGVVALIILSCVLNVLLLGGSLYMMMVYDSVLPSQSIPTLLSLLVLILIVYLFQAGFEIIRSRVLGDMAAHLTGVISPRVQQAITHMALRGVAPKGGDSLSPLRDLDTIRQFLSSTGPTAFLDLPWMIFFLLVLAVLHPLLGLTALVGALVLIGLAYRTAKVSDAPTRTVMGISGKRLGMAEETRRHVELIRALGMEKVLNRRWNKINAEMLSAQDKLGDDTAVIGGISRVFRMFLQSLVLSVGAWLVIEGKASGGVIFAGSILAARALAPIDQVVAQWKPFAAAKAALIRLESVLEAVPSPTQTTLPLPAPSERVTFEQVFSGPPGSNRLTVQGVSFELKAGEALGIIGLSAAGKSSLIRTLAGIWQPVRGSVRLDGAELSQWDPERLGRHIGYVSQSVELLSGTVAQNIARFAEDIDSEAVLAAARSAGAHDMIVHLPNGYETQVGADGEQLSGGQRQWIALARALYGNPFLVLLDEPNSNLDAMGEAALDRAILEIRQRKGIVVVVAHRRAAIARLSHLLVMRDGRIEKFGPRDEVLGSFPQSVAQPGADAKPAVGNQSPGTGAA
jgi:ATP-binding cassette subfamily C protein